MKRNIYLLIFALCATSFAIAQDIYEYDVKPEELISKEVTLKGAYAREELPLILSVKWWEMENRIQLIFDRKQVNTNDAYLLFFPFFDQKTEIKGIVDCKFRKKLLWTKDKGSQLKYMSYFLESDNLVIDDFRNCYSSLANNNEDEFEFTLKDVENEIRITLNGLYVARTSKRPWYYLSRRDKKLEFKVQPTTLLIRFPVVAQKADICAVSERAIPYIQEVHKIMLEEYAELLDAQKKQSCTYFDFLKSKIYRYFVDTNAMGEKYKECEEIMEALKVINEVWYKIQDETCKAAVTATATCSLSETELSSINNRLRNLQMKINIKIKDGNSTAEELKDYQSIINAVNPKLTAECRKRYKDYIDAYSSYCNAIEGLLR